MASTIAATAAEYQTDTFKTKSGKEVVITAIKHASLRIQYDGLEIQVDPVVKFAPETDYAKFPKADIILVTHEHFDHFDRDAIAALEKDVTQVVANPSVQKMLGHGTATARRWRTAKAAQSERSSRLTPFPPTTRRRAGRSFIRRAATTAMC